MFATLQRDSERLFDNILTLIYFMRGSVSYTEAVNMSYAERQLVFRFVEKRFEIEKKNPNPVY